MPKSKEVITQSPMSVVGFTKRYLRWTHADGGAAKMIVFLPRWLVYIPSVLTVMIWNIFAWVLFFWFTLPWRHFRNSARREKRRQAEHAELIQALQEGR